MREPFEWIFSALHWLWSAIRSHAKTIGIVAGIGTFGGLLKWLADIRKSWHEGNLAKFQLQELRKAKEDEDRLPGLVKMAGEKLEDYRREHKLAGRLVYTEEFLAGLLPHGTDTKLVQRVMAELEEKQEKFRRRFGLR